MAKRKMTIDDLARLVKEGFDETARKSDFMALRSDMGSFQKWTMRRFDRVDEDFRMVKRQLPGLVNRLEFEKLETRVKDIEDLLAVVTKRR